MNVTQDFNFAVAFTAYDNERENILDPSIGELVYKAYQWGYDDNGDVYEELVTLKTHVCSGVELGLADPAESNFLPFNNEGTKEEINRYKKKFYCLDEDEMRIYGDWSSWKARQLRIQLSKC